MKCKCARCGHTYKKGEGILKTDFGVGRMECRTCERKESIEVIVLLGILLLVVFSV